MLDLHNNFLFVSFINDKVTNKIVIHFEKAVGDWVHPNELKKLTFTLSNINYLRLIDPKPEYISDDHVLAGITFFYPDDREENYGLINRQLPEKGYDIIFTFESDRVIRVNCDSVILSVEQ